jgi:hypothetical protein
MKITCRHFGITFNQGVDILGKKCLISQILPVDILGVDILGWPHMHPGAKFVLKVSEQ